MPRDYTPVFYGATALPEPEEENPGSGFLSTARDTLGGLLKAQLNVGPHFLDSFVTLGEDLASWATGTEQEWVDLNLFDEEELGTLGQIYQEVGTFALGLVSGSSILSALGKAGKLGTLGKMAMGAYGWKGKAAVDAGLGFAGDFVLGDTRNGNLSNLLEEFPSLKDSVLTYLRHEEDDSNLEKRLKNAMEGLPLGLAGDFLFEGFSRVLRHKRAVIDSVSAGNAEKAAEMIARETGELLPAPDADTGVLKALTGETADDAFPKAVERSAASAVDDAPAFRPEDLGNLRSAEEVKTLIQNGETLDSLFRNVVTAPDVERLMDATGSLVRKDDGWSLQSVADQANAALEKLGGDTALLREEMKKGAEATREMSARILVGTAAAERMGNDLITLARGIVSATEPTTLEIQKFLELVGDYRELVDATLDFRRNAARVVTAHRTMILDGKVYRSLRELPETALKQGTEGPALHRLLKDNLDFTDGVKNARKLAEEILQLSGDPASFHRNLKKAGDSSVWIKGIKTIAELRTANILSGVATQGVNVMGNLLNFVLRDGFDQLIASAYGAVLGRKNRVHVSAALSGIAHSFDGIKLMWKDLKQAKSAASGTWSALKDRGGTFYALTNFIEKASEHLKVLDPLNRRAAEGMHTPAVSAKFWNLDETSLGGTLLDFIGNVWRAPSLGVMGVMDNVATDMAFSSALSRNLRNYALNSGMSPTVMGQFEKRMRQAVVAYAREGTIPKMAEDQLRLVGRFYQEALDSARAATFKSPLDPDGNASHLMRWLNKDQMTPQIIKCFVTPFVKTPVNILDSIWARTPLLGRLRSEFRSALKSGDQAAIDLLNARMISGGLMYGLGASLYFSGQLTGAHDRNERDSLLAAGIPEYSVRIGGKWYSYNRLDPVGSFLGISADLFTMSRYLTDGDYGSLAGALIMVGANNVLNKTYMQGLTDLSDLIGDPRRYMESFGVQQIQALIPFVGTQRSINQAIAPEQRELRDVTDRILSATVLRKDLPEKLDMFGESIPVEKTPLALILGIRTVTERSDDPVRMELARYGLFPKDSLKRIMGEEITGEENQQFKQAMRDLGISKNLRAFVTGHYYANMNDSMRIKALRNLIQRHREAAKRLTVSRNPDLKSRILERKKRVLERLRSTPEGARNLAESWNDLRAYRVEDDGDE